MGKILFVDDDQTMRQAMRLTLMKHDLTIAGGLEEAVTCLQNKDFELLLTDLFMPDLEDGLNLVQQARTRDDDLQIVVITGFGTIETAVQAIKRGADDYLTKDFTPDSLRLKVEHYLQARQNRDRLKKLEAENSVLKQKIFPVRMLLGESGPMREVLRRIELAAQDNESTVLVLGKSGTGKELVARQIHEQGLRSHNTFVAIDCPTFPKELFESELFGHEKGAFTDAKSRKLGRIELAHQGTLYLDEIGDLPLPLQAKLLRFLETSEFYRIGSSKPQRVDVRILASTNQDLHQMVEQGQFRADLYYRLQVIVINTPDLKERKEDIPLLAQSFLDEFNLKKKKDLRFSKDHITRMMLYDWPGNVRELKNAVESFAVLGDLPLPQTPDTILDKPYKEARREALDDFERTYIRMSLFKHERNVTRTAQDIGISREELSRKISRLNL
ncbi:sigma-54-dependent Fis family transcriptional regulator [bacterium]|nr:sigma-54-dependent Fis family transcriptional regulator [bacterium]